MRGSSRRWRRMKAGRPYSMETRVSNEDRTLGARLAGELALARGPDSTLGKPELHFKMNGVAGQSFGAFAAEGMTLELDGLANDFVGKGLSGGTLICVRRGGLPGRAENTRCWWQRGALRGNRRATVCGGEAGERFAVRNSGVLAVVEGVGDHGCEYMTGGLVAVLGATGMNFGAGMTGGLAWVYDENGEFLGKGRHHKAFWKLSPGTNSTATPGSRSGSWWSCTPPTQRAPAQAGCSKTGRTRRPSLCGSRRGRRRRRKVAFSGENCAILGWKMGRISSLGLLIG